MGYYDDLTCKTPPQKNRRLDTMAVRAMKWGEAPGQLVEGKKETEGEKREKERERERKRIESERETLETA